MTAILAIAVAISKSTLAIVHVLCAGLQATDQWKARGDLLLPGHVLGQSLRPLLDNDEMLFKFHQSSFSQFSLMNNSPFHYAVPWLPKSPT